MLNPISQRIKIIIDRESNGNVKSFAEKLGNISQQGLSRIFRPDPRSGTYPTPSTELIILITSVFVNYNPCWILLGEGKMMREQSLPGLDIDEDVTNWKEEYTKIKLKYEEQNEKYITLLEKFVK